MNPTPRPAPARAGRRVREPVGDLAALTACAAVHLAPDGEQNCRLIWFRRKMRKLILEFETKTAVEVATPAIPAVSQSRPHTRMRYIGKRYATDRGQGSFEAQLALWGAGFRPPAAFTVARPIAYVRDRCLLLQEKAPGRPVAAVLLNGPQAATALTASARWLAALHACHVAAPSRRGWLRTSVVRYGVELSKLLPAEAVRLDRLTACALAGLDAQPAAPLVPSHGDFHPKNVFVAASGRVTAIDLDTFGAQDRTADVAYFLTQAAVMGRFHLGSFAATAAARSCFLRSYQEAVPGSLDRLALYMGVVLLQSLYYELCVLRTGNGAIVEPWLRNAQRCLLDGAVELVDGDEPCCRLR